VLRGRHDECGLDRLVRAEPRGECRMLVLHERRAPTVYGWPVKAVSVQDAAEQLPVLRTVGPVDQHNLAFPEDVHIIPAVVRPAPGPPPST
jgi:hypothetical protein